MWRDNKRGLGGVYLGLRVNGYGRWEALDFATDLLCWFRHSVLPLLHPKGTFYVVQNRCFSGWRDRIFTGYTWWVFPQTILTSVAYFNFYIALLGLRTSTEQWKRRDAIFRTLAYGLYDIRVDYRWKKRHPVDIYRVNESSPSSSDVCGFSVNDNCKNKGMGNRLPHQRHQTSTIALLEREGKYAHGFLGGRFFFNGFIRLVKKNPKIHPVGRKPCLGEKWSHPRSWLHYRFGVTLLPSWMIPFMFFEVMNKKTAGTVFPFSPFNL